MLSTILFLFAVLLFSVCCVLQLKLNEVERKLASTSFRLSQIDAEFTVARTGDQDAIIDLSAALATANTKVDLLTDLLKQGEQVVIDLVHSHQLLTAELESIEQANIAHAQRELGATLVRGGV